MIILAPMSFSVFWLGIFTVVSVIFYMILQCNWAFQRVDFWGTRQNIFNNTLFLAKGNLVIWFSTLGALSFGVINQLILKFYCGKESLGNYAAAWQIVLLATLFINQVARIGRPAMARITRLGISKSARVRFLIKYSTAMCLVICPFFLATIICPEFILKLIYSSEYVSAASTLRLMGIYLIILGFTGVVTQYLVSARLEKPYLCNILIGGTVSLSLSLVLIPKYGDLGAIVALLCAHSLLILLNCLVIVNQLRKD